MFLTQECRKRKADEARKELEAQEIETAIIREDIYVEGHSIEKSRTKRKRVCSEHGNEAQDVGESLDKNRGISDMDKMVFEKKFKNYLNHKQ